MFLKIFGAIFYNILMWSLCYGLAYLFFYIIDCDIFSKPMFNKRTLKILSVIFGTALFLFAIWATDGDILKPHKV